MARELKKAKKGGKMQQDNQSPNQAPSTPTSQPGAELPPRTGLRQSYIYLLTLLALMLVIGLIIGVTHKNKPSNSTSTSQTSVNMASVQITANGFIPADLQVKAGTVVTWTNSDSAQHQVASDPYPKDDALAGLKSPSKLNKNDTYSFTFEHAGTYTYHDELNPYKLTGTVTVK